MGDEQITPHDADELARCFAAHAPGLFGQACVLARGDRAVAEDLVQAAFEAAGQAWPTLRGLAAEQTRGWLWGMLAQIAASGSRHEAAAGGSRHEAAAGGERHEAAAGGGRPLIGVRYREVPASRAEPAFSSMTLERCWRAILQMPEPQHMVAMFRWQLDMKEAEIAEALGLAAETVSALLDRARRKLIAQLGPDHPFTRDDAEGASS